MTAPLLFVAERFPPDIGGLAQSGARIAQALTELGQPVDVLAWTRSLPPGALRTTEPGDGGPVVHHLGLFANLDLSMQHTANVVEWLHGERGYGRVWGHYLFPAGFAATLMGKTLGLPVVVSARGNDVDRMTFPPGDFARLLWTLERADLVTTVSEDLARKVAVLLGRTPALQVLPNAVDVDTFTPGAPSDTLRASLGIAAGEVVLGFSGELRHKKGFPFMLDALAHLRRSRAACLLVIGEVRPAAVPYIQRFASDHPEAAERILVTGRLDERALVVEHLRLCDVFLQPSMWDGMPNAVLEAMACARCVVASDAGGIAEVVEHGQSGVVLPRARLHLLGHAIAELLDQPAAVRDEMGHAARRRVETRFRPEHERTALAETLRRLDALD